MKALHYSCQGESHKATNKVCQDYSYSEVNDHLAIAIVCDGHGGTSYFRSDVGARYATNITKECVTTFIDNIDKKLFHNAAFTQVCALNTEIENDNFDKKTKVDVAMRQLFSSIIYRWQAKILEHAHDNPLTEAEKTSLNPHYITDFEASQSLEKTYGCTLMCYVQTTDYWFAFHVGDGKCIAFDQEGKWSEPIPWDDRCFLNKTTSLCDADALNEFRYCYQGDGQFPVAVFLGSDGIDDSFGETTNMVNFYAQVAKMLAKDAIEESMNSIQTTLPELSAKGSQDDMSIACIYDECRLESTSKYIIQWQQRNVHEAIISLNNRIEQLTLKYDGFVGKTISSKREQIDYMYTLKELRRAFESKRELAKKYDRFSQELGGDFTPYTDEYGFGENFVLSVEPTLTEQSPEDESQQKDEEQKIDVQSGTFTADVDQSTIDEAKIEHNLDKVCDDEDGTGDESNVVQQQSHTESTQEKIDSSCEQLTQDEIEHTDHEQ